MILYDTDPPPVFSTTSTDPTNTGIVPDWARTDPSAPLKLYPYNPPPIGEQVFGWINSNPNIVYGLVGGVLLLALLRKKR